MKAFVYKKISQLAKLCGQVGRICSLGHVLGAQRAGLFILSSPSMPTSQWLLNSYLLNKGIPLYSERPYRYRNRPVCNVTAEIKVHRHREQILPTLLQRMMGVIQATMFTLSESINDDQQRWNGSQQETENIQGADNHYTLISLP